MLRASRLRIVGALAAAIAFLAASTLTGLSTTAHADGSAVTVTGQNAWDPANNTTLASPSTVTVAQTTNLVDQVVRVTWANFTPSDTLWYDVLSTHYPVSVYQCQGTDVTKQVQCAGTAEYNTLHSVNNSADTNLVNTFTSPDGTGYADIAVRTSVTDSELGCDDSHKCSIVVVPNWGGNDQPGTGTGDCSDHSADFGSSLGMSERSCAWGDRLVVPISFSRGPTVCDSGNPNFNSSGSPMLQRAVDLWRSSLCAGTNADRVSYNSGVNEYAARTDFMNGRTDMGFTTQPATIGTRKFAYAPMAVSGVSIAYYVDNANTGKPITNLKLNARLVAKMLTQSYSMTSSCPASGTQIPCSPEVTGNPSSILTDPEFLALNPDYQLWDYATPISTGTFPLVVQGDSDLTYELTRWVQSDPQAHAFLTGAPDPWGMRVNKYYLPTSSPKYPISSFTANDPGQIHHLHIGAADGCDSNFACDAWGAQALWNPISGLDHISQKLLGAVPSSVAQLAACDPSKVVNGFCSNHPADPPQDVGQRGIFAVVPEADAAAYQFPTAALATTDGHFVQPTTDSMTAAMSSMHTNSDGVTQQVDHSKSNPDAYPLTMVDYAMVPTCGVASSKATKISQFLGYVGSDAGQVYGGLPGQLAPGFAALTDAQRAQTNKAAAAVGTQSCTTDKPPSGGDKPPTNKPGGDNPPANNPPSDNPPTSDGNNNGSNNDTNNSGTNDNGNGSNNNSGDNSSSDSPSNSSSSPTNNDSSAPTKNDLTSNTNTPQNVSFGKPDPDKAGFTRIMLPLLLIIGGALIIGGPAVFVLGKTGAGPVIVSRVKSLFRRG